MYASRLALYNTQDIRACEYKAVHELGITEEELMERAGNAVLQACKQNFADARKLAVFCGGGNNGGDGYVVARLAYLEGFSVIIYEYKKPSQLTGAAQKAAILAEKTGICFKPLTEACACEAEVIIDALLGIGVQGVVKPCLSEAIHSMNCAGIPILSIDVPSGLDADTGRVLGAGVRATMTVSFIAQKTGFYTLDGPDCCGKIIHEDLNLTTCLDDVKTRANILDGAEFKKKLLPRFNNCHKGMFGHLLLIGGGQGMPGAIWLAAKAALSVGAGSVTIATWPEYAKSTMSFLPEAMVYGIDKETTLSSLLSKATVCVFGPGLGEDDWAEMLMHQVLSVPMPMVIDASGLRLLGKMSMNNSQWVLTPHPGEASHMLACSTSEIQMDRYQAVERLQQRYGGVVVLKGCGTLVRARCNNTYVCSLGNPGMASAGMGDVLSGIIGGLLAQSLSSLDAAALGVWLHARAGDLLASDVGKRGLLASEIISYLRRALTHVD